jgi:hypothetical protein
MVWLPVVPLPALPALPLCATATLETRENNTAAVIAEVRMSAPEKK